MSNLRNEEDEGNTVSHREGAASGTMGEQGPGKLAPPPKERPRSPMRRQATIRSQERCALNAHNHGDRAAKPQRTPSRGQQGVVGDPLKEPHASGRDMENAWNPGSQHFTRCLEKAGAGRGRVRGSARDDRPWVRTVNLRHGLGLLVARFRRPHFVAPWRGSHRGLGLLAREKGVDRSATRR